MDCVADGISGSKMGFQGRNNWVRKSKLGQDLERGRAPRHSFKKGMEHAAEHILKAQDKALGKIWENYGGVSAKFLSGPSRVKKRGRFPAARGPLACFPKNSFAFCKLVSP